MTRKVVNKKFSVSFYLINVTFPVFVLLVKAYCVFVFLYCRMLNAGPKASIPVCLPAIYNV